MRFVFDDQVGQNHGVLSEVERGQREREREAGRPEGELPTSPRLSLASDSS